MQTNEKIVALGVGKKGCQVVEQMLGKIEDIEFADVRFQASDEILDLFNAPLKFSLKNPDECKKSLTKIF